MFLLKCNITDIHTHILPGIDDGCRNLEESLALVRSFLEQGISEVIATPHYRNRAYLGDAGPIVEAYNTLCDAIRNTEFALTAGTFKLHLGQELHYTESLPELLENGTCLTLAGSHYVLIEFANEAPYEEIYRGMRRIIEAGYTPILAHMERCIFLDGEYAARSGTTHHAGKAGHAHKNVRELRKLGCRMQMNYDSLYYEKETFFTRFFDKEVKRCRKLIQEGLIDLLATDAHSPSFRPPNTKPAIDWLTQTLSQKEIERLTDINPKNIIGDNKLI